MHPRKLAAVAAMPPAARYAYFVQKVCDFKSVWGLYGGGWATGSADSVVVVPVWPEPEFAALNANGEWNALLPSEIPLNDFMKNWIPGATADHRKIQVFPMPNQRGAVVDGERLLADLTSELSTYD